ncbi:MAG: carbon-nitrogen hydrolase family protein [Pseudomonadota bacterium]
MHQDPPSSDTLSLLACQITVPSMTTTAERDAHLKASVQKVRHALKSACNPVDLAVLPELSSLDYAPETFDALETLAEPLDGPSFIAWRALAMEARVHVCYGFARHEGGQYYISMAVVGPNGDRIGHYDKLHLAQFGASGEKAYFTRGDYVFTFEVKGFKLAPIICYDIRIPELSRTLAIDHDVTVILHCGAYYRDESFPTWHPFAITRALENQVYLLSLNRAGPTYGNSLFCPPWQDDHTPPLSFKETREDLRQITLNMQSVTEARQNYTFLGDRLPDYGAGLSPANA